MMTRKLLVKSMAVALLALVAGASFAQQRHWRDDDEPNELRSGRQDVRKAYRDGYERGFERGYERAKEEASRRPPRKPPGPPAIRISKAAYGTSQRSCDATRYVTRRADGERSHSFKVSNEMCGDPTPGQRKTLQVTYWCGSNSKTVSAREHDTLFMSCP